MKSQQNIIELVTRVLRQVRRHPHVLRRGPDQLAAELPRDVVKNVDLFCEHWEKPPICQLNLA